MLVDTPPPGSSPGAKSFKQAPGLAHVDILHNVAMSYRFNLFFRSEKSSEGADEGQQIVP
jgi:hypothetical protein